jgi:phospholipase/carboxylesterase
LPTFPTAKGPHAGQPVRAFGRAMDSSSTVAIMIHGRGASPEDILGLATAFDRPDVTYLAPAAANNTWYPYSFLTEIAKNEPYLSSALSVLGALVAEIQDAGVPRDRIVMMGFSQGACLTSEFAIRNASRFGGFVAFSGGAIGPPGTRWNDTHLRQGYGGQAGPFAGTPMFFGCSDIDPHIPEERVNETAALCARMGATVTKKIYPGMGHLVNDDEIAHARALLDSVTG